MIGRLKRTTGFFHKHTVETVHLEEGALVEIRVWPFSGTCGLILGDLESILTYHKLDIRNYPLLEDAVEILK